VRSRLCTFIFLTLAPDWVFTVLFYNTPTMSDGDPKDTDLVTDTREEDVLPAGLIVAQAASDVLDPTLNKRAANEETSASNKVKNGGTTEYSDADTREDLFPAGLIVAQATCDNLDATETRSPVDEDKNVATSENADDTISTLATADIVLQARVDSEAKQLSSLANELGSAGDYIKSAEETVLPQAPVQPLSLAIDLKHAASQQETSADDASVPKKQVEAEPSYKELNLQATVQARLVKTANRAHMAGRSTLVRATDGKKIALINGTKYKSLISSYHQAALVAEARAAAVLTDCIVSAKKSAQNDSAVTTVLIHAKSVAFAAKKRQTVASTVNDEDVLNNLRNGHQECQLLTQQFVTLAERELTVCLCPPPSSPGYSPPASPKKNPLREHVFPSHASEAFRQPSMHDATEKQYFLVQRDKDRHSRICNLRVTPL
jgi:hypothetical protein